MAPAPKAMRYNCDSSPYVIVNTKFNYDQWIENKIPKFYGSIKKTLNLLNWRDHFLDHSLIIEP